MNKNNGQILLFFLVLSVLYVPALAQKPLQRSVSVHAVRQPLAQILLSLEKQGGYYFSYNSTIIPADSLVSLQIEQRPTSEVLALLLPVGYQFKEVSDHIVIQKAHTEKYLYVQSRLLDAESGEPVDYASVYSKALMLSAISDETGQFRLRLREKALPQFITISKLGYRDTVLNISEALPEGHPLYLRRQVILLDEAVITSSGADGNFLSRLLVSARLRAHSRNLSRFFVSFPYQASLIPGIGTHGRMGSQVVNKASLNLVGGYTAGTNGVEVAGGFNIARKDVQYLQAAGLFNFVSGKVSGLQAAGIYNSVQDTLTGIQAAGLANVNESATGGLQAAGVFNHTQGTVSGVQAAGVANLTRQDFRGLQAAGLINRTAGTMNGLQISGLINSAGHLKGTQIGLINLADSSSGLSVGLINLIGNGKSDLSLSANEVMPLLLDWKTGTPSFYTLLALGSALPGEPKRYSMGLGIGVGRSLGRRWYLAAEITQHTIFQGSFEDAALWMRFQPLIRFSPVRAIAVFAGPAFSTLYRKGSPTIADGFDPNPLGGLKIREIQPHWALWTGWQAGLTWRMKK